jgi:NACalpha-BTF3-like transcription factor
MSHKHENLIRTIFHDPISGNIQWREVESLLRHLGVEMEQLSGARIRAKLGHAETILHRPHHSNTLDRHAVQHLREFLARGGATPSQYEARQEQRKG